MNGTILVITKRLAKAAGFQLANGCNLADRDTCADQKSLTMQKALAVCDDIEAAISFLYSQQEEIESLKEANFKLKCEINEYAEKVEKLCNEIDAYRTAEQEIPGR
jgi:uncharacterized protein involved in tolerance to divalent cations